MMALFFCVSVVGIVVLAWAAVTNNPMKHDALAAYLMVLGATLFLGFTCLLAATMSAP